MKISEVHELFKKSNLIVKIGLSKFSNLKPTHILPVNVCVCPIHANVDLVLKSLKSTKIAFLKKAWDVVERLMFDIWNDKCINN